VALAFATHALLGAASGALAGRTTARRIASLMVAFATLAVPFLVPGPAWLRALLALGSVVVLFRAIDLARDPDHGWPLRIGLMFAILDLRQVRGAPVLVEPHRLLTGIGCGAGSVVCFWLALGADALLLRWLAGVAAVYLMAQGADALTQFGWNASGFRIPKQHDSPVLATSVSEFWSRRWNVNVRDWLARNCHRPLARRGHATVGVLFAFAASAMLHFWFIVVALGAFLAAIMASFFVLHALFVLVEGKVGVSRWPIGLRRAWTIALLVGSSPLFVEPFLRLLK
jgi:hypothetical protein